MNPIYTGGKRFVRIEEISIYHQMSCFVKPLARISHWVSTSKGLLKQSTGKGENELVVEVRWLGFISKGPSLHRRING